MTWEPKNRTEDEDEDALASDDEKPRHSEEMSMNSVGVGCAERRRPLGMEYPGGAINVTIGNNTTVAGNIATGAAAAATTGAGAVDGGVSGVGATIAAVTSTASAATNQHSHSGGTSVGAVGAIQPTKGKLPKVKQTASQTQDGHAKAHHEATLI